MINIINTKMTKQVIEEIIEIDKEFYLNFDFSDTSWYYAHYNENNDITVLKVDNKIVGYYLFCTISNKLYEDICNLKYAGDYEFPETEVNVDSKIYYLPSVLVKSDYRNYSYLLLNQLVKDFLVKDKVVAMAVSEQGKRMCEKFMKYIGSPKPIVSVYTKG